MRINTAAYGSQASLISKVPDSFLCSFVSKRESSNTDLHNLISILLSASNSSVSIVNIIIRANINQNDLHKVYCIDSVPSDFQALINTSPKIEENKHIMPTNLTEANSPHPDVKPRYSQ